jgi:hypothetical protein
MECPLFKAWEKECFVDYEERPEAPVPYIVLNYYLKKIDEGVCYERCGPFRR